MAGNANEVERRIGYPGPLMLLLFWTVIGSLAYARHYVQDHNVAPGGKVLFEFLGWLTCFYPWIALTPLVFRLERRWPLGTRRWLKSLGGLALAGFPIVYIAGVLAQTLYVLLQLAFRDPVSPSFRWWNPAESELGIQAVLYCTALGGAYLVRMLIQLHEREQQATKLALEKSQLEATLRQAQLNTLRARLNPHFLFNSLQNVSVLTREDPHAASQMLARLGALLRTSLRRDDTPETTLAAEIELTKAYVAVERVRFADRLTVLFDVAPESERALVPALLLQPLVENAIRHGLRGVEHTGVISIRSAVEEGTLTINVTDNGIGFRIDPTGSQMGIGLSSTQERLEMMYPQQHSFSIRSLPEGGTQVRVAIPLRLETPQAGVVSDERDAIVGR